MSKQVGIFFQIFVAFLESLKFNLHVDHLCMYHDFLSFLISFTDLKDWSSLRVRVNYVYND